MENVLRGTLDYSGYKISKNAITNIVNRSETNSLLTLVGSKHPRFLKTDKMRTDNFNSPVLV